MNETQPEYIIIGTISGAWGLRGHVKIDVETDFPERFSPDSVVYIEKKPVKVEEVNWQKGRAIVKFSGLDDEETAIKLRGTLVEIHRSQLYDLKEGEYYYFEIIGLRVVTTLGEPVGEVTEIMTMAGADIYVVQGENGEVLVPAAAEFVRSVDREAGLITIEPVEGLLNLNEKKGKPQAL
jgi:16S rRNA processing protein RimM